MAENVIMLTRHGERPLAGGGKPHGFTAEGKLDEHALSARGWARAGALSPAVPPGWPEDRFDMVYVLRRTTDGRYAFSQVPELLLPGDSAEPIG